MAKRCNRYLVYERHADQWFVCLLFLWKGGKHEEIKEEQKMES